MKSTPAVQTYMTYAAKSVHAEQTIAHAYELLRKLHLGHLPVLKWGKLVGILTRKDVKRALRNSALNPQTTKIEGHYAPEQHSASPDTPLANVVRHMRDNECGCVFIIENGELVGIFTEANVYRALADFLKSNPNKVQ